MRTAQTGRTHGCTDQPAGVKKVLANPEPSTHGTFRTSPDVRLESVKRATADIRSGRAHLATYECLAYIPDMSRQDSKRARHRQRQAETGQCERPSPGALRARRSRADGRNGLRTFRVRVHMGRMIAALRAAHRISDL